MIIIRNLPQVAKFYGCLKHLTQFKNEIIDARAKGDIEREKKNILLATSTWGPELLKSIGITYEVYGEENLPTEGPVVYMCNHQGFADIPLLCAVLNKIQVGFVAKKSLSKVPLYGNWIDLVRSIMIQRDDPRESLKAINSAVKYVEQGFSMVIFPEGTRSRGPELGEFKKGATKLATKPGVPIVPITLDGTYRAYEESGKIQGTNVKVMIHPPIQTKDMSRQEEKLLSDKVEQIIRDGLTELRKND